VPGNPGPLGKTAIKPERNREVELDYSDTKDSVTVHSKDLYKYSSRLGLQD